MILQKGAKVSNRPELDREPQSGVVSAAVGDQCLVVLRQMKEASQIFWRRIRRVPAEALSLRCGEEVYGHGDVPPLWRVTLSCQEKRF